MSSQLDALIHLTYKAAPRRITRKTINSVISDFRIILVGRADAVVISTRRPIPTFRGVSAGAAALSVAGGSGSSGGGEPGYGVVSGRWLCFWPFGIIAFVVGGGAFGYPGRGNRAGVA